MDKGRILIVDDDEDILTLVAHLLGKAGYEILTVNDSGKAYEKIIEFSPDMIILDFMMPGINGEELMKIIKSGSLTGQIPIMFLSAVSMPDQIRGKLRAGAFDYLTKPIHPDVLRAKVDIAMENIKHAKMVHNIISRYLGPDVAKMIMNEPEQVKVYGIRKPIVCMFVDIRGFTSLVETMEPEEIVKLLNAVLTDLSDAIFSIGGTIDKFMGDGLMAFWGAPLPADNIEILAVEAAILMLRKLRTFNRERRYPGGLEILVGIGISFGEAVVGNIGSEKRSDYTVIGESVNVAARLEKMAKPEQILIDEGMYKKVKNDYPCKEVGELDIKGKTFPINVYEIVVPLDSKE